MMNWSAIQVIVYKDVKVIAQNKQFVLSLILVPCVLLALFPFLAVQFPAVARVLVPPLAGLDGLPAHLPAALQGELVGLNARQRWDLLTLVYFLAPVYLVVPLSTASTIAADSFAGEKERKTLEALLYSPTTDREVFVAKILSPWLIGVGIALLGFLLYTLVANLVSWPDMGRIFFPTAMWLVLALWVVPACAGLGLSIMGLISVRAKSVREANQLGGMIVVPLLLLMFGQAIGLFYLNVWFVCLLGLVLWGVDGIALWLAGRIFQRHSILARL